jgi:hypothetical protein
LVEPSLFLPRHGTCSDWEAFAVRKLDNNTEEIPAGRCLAEDIVYRIGSCRLGALHQSPAKTHIFDLFRVYPVSGNVCNSVFWPDKFVDFHNTFANLDFGLFSAKMRF